MNDAGRRARSAVIVGVIVGLVAWLWGLFELHRIFFQERQDAYANVNSWRSALQEYALRALEEPLRRDMGRGRQSIATALSDPLVDAQALLLVENGEQRLPRRVSFKPGDDHPSQDQYERLRRIASGTATPATLTGGVTDPWSARLDLLAQLGQALRDHDRPAIERTVRAMLAHRAHYVIAVTRDLPYLIAALDHFVAHGRPDNGLLRALVREGLADRRGGHLEGLQSALLRHRSRFTAPDFAFLRDRVADLSRQAHVADDIFLARANEPKSAPVELPATLSGPTLVGEGRWVVETSPAGEIHGIAIDLAARLRSVGQQMRRGGLLGVDDTLVLAAWESTTSSVADLPLRVESPRWARAGADAEARYRLKVLLGGVSGLLAAAIVALVILLQHRARRFLQLKSDFVSTVSHELRTPLAAIRLMAETLQRRLRGETRAKDYPSRIVREIDGLGFLVENILSFNRLDKGRWRAHLAAVDLDGLIAELGESPDLYTTKPVAWRISGLESMRLQADPELMKLLFLNLARNACQHNQREPVRIEVTGHQAKIPMVEFADNGVGIPPEARRQLFDAFFRADASRRTRGSGLGLAICRRIMRLHKGEIRLVETSSAGTRFALEFPEGAS